MTHIFNAAKEQNYIKHRADKLTKLITHTRSIPVVCDSMRPAILCLCSNAEKTVNAVKLRAEALQTAEESADINRDLCYAELEMLAAEMLLS